MNEDLSRLLRRARWQGGQILLPTALLATALVAFAALVIDAGFMTAQRRQAQNAADASALATARVLFQGGTLSQAEDAGLEYADANGYDDVDRNSVDINIPPESGEHEGDPNFVEVIVEEQPTSFLIHAVVPGVFSVRARGVAGFQLYPEPYALVVLDEHDCQAFNQEGGANLAVAGGGVMVNSDCAPNAFNKTGTGTLSADGAIDVHGEISHTGSGTVSPSPETVPWTVENPLADLVPPARGDPAPGSQGTAAVPAKWSHSGGSNLTLYPGTYYGGLYTSCTCTVTMMPGTYVMAGGGFTKEGGARIEGDEVTIYVTTNPTNPTGDGAPAGVRIAGSGTMALTPPTSGDYEGITFWQDEAITDDFVLRGDNSLTQGLFYAPGARLNIEGSTSLGVAQLVVKKFHIAGSASLSLIYGEFRTFEAPDVALVE